MDTFIAATKSACTLFTLTSLGVLFMIGLSLVMDLIASVFGTAVALVLFFIFIFVMVWSGCFFFEYMWRLEHEEGG